MRTPIYRLVVVLIALSIIGVGGSTLLVYGTSQLSNSPAVMSPVVKLQSTPGAASTLPPELPPDTKVLELGKPIREAIKPNDSGRFYRFTGKKDQVVALSLIPTAGTAYTSIAILDASLQTIIGATQGESVVGGTLIVRLPAEGLYVVTADYADTNLSTPTPGSFEIVLNEYKIGAK